ncbi:Hypothetical predicted protein [Olea europaea subsp. europaea]|uniref:Uncharacterized protein n=2 Tax=Olea europaea subsp. europaea TaxID=158383 RepID=A0A8S0RYM2_OLEEU|nr:Hypothetical predicted protein [Olea europaea subsp. europaea]
MLRQNNPNGWPLGLGNMNMRFALEEASVSAEAVPYAAHRSPSSNFSSKSSSNLDTESTASFFTDQSVSLGRLIGIGLGNRGNMHCPNTVIGQQHGSLRSQPDASKYSDDSQGLCVPLLNNVIGKMSRCRSSSRHRKLSLILD